MKKFLTIMLASMIIFAMTAPAMAMHFDMSGKLRVRSFVMGNYVNGDDSSEWVDQRLRIKGTWGIVENVSLTFRADVLEGFWGDFAGALGEQVATDPISTNLILQTGVFQQVGTKSQIAFDWVYGSFVIPSTNTAIHLGRQGVNWGTKAAVAADNRDRLKIIQPAGAVKLGFVYDKFRENFILNSTDDGIQDSQGIGVLAIGDLGGFKSGIIYYYVSNKSLPTIDTITSNVDIYTMGKAGNVDIKAEINYVWGERETNNVAVDLTGIIAYGGLGFNAGMTNLGLEVAYARGDDPGSSDENEGAASMDYDGPFYSIVLYNNLDYDGFQSVKGADRGVSNALAVKASVTAKPSEKLTLGGAVVWAQQDELSTAGATNGIDDDLGVEVDGVLMYNIYDNVVYTLGLGYLFAGDAFGGELDDPWAMMNRIQIHF